MQQKRLCVREEVVGAELYFGGDRVPVHWGSHRTCEPVGAGIFGLRYVSVCACRSGFKDLFLSGLRRRGLSYQLSSVPVCTVISTVTVDIT